MKSMLGINYSLQFHPNLKTAKFSGDEIITAKSSLFIKRITLDASELDIQACVVKSKGILVESHFSTSVKEEKLIITLNKSIRGTFEIMLKFNGILNDKLLGFYKSIYTDKKGKKHYIATTQFEAADARRAFPCWDEPSAKATFDVTITTESKYMAISNMPVQSRKKIGLSVAHKFMTTPVMSTYLLYLGVGEFATIQTKLRDISIRVITTPDNIRRGKFALDFAKKILNEYEKYFKIQYPLPKLDLLAIPDFAAGAMENWGAITFRESILLYDSKTSSAKTKQFIAEVISHEIAHQWFGNLVTMEWWNDLWLNESFATFMAIKFVDKFYPKWKLWDQFVGDTISNAMNLDSLQHSHPIDVPVKHPSEIREIFDSISYDKGGSVLRMLEHFIGEASFQKGLQIYLKHFKYSNATGNDLWTQLGKTSGKNVRKIMNSWISQTGYPLVKLAKKKNHLSISQTRFTMRKKRLSGMWPIPIALTDNSTNYIVMSKKTLNVSSKYSLNVNPQKHGFYRIIFDKSLSNLNDILSVIINPIDRWSLENDLYATTIYGHTTLNNYLTLVGKLNADTDYLVRSDIIRNLSSLLFHSRAEKFYPILQDVSRNYLQTVFSDLGWSAKRGEPHVNIFLRSAVIHLLGRLNDDPIIHAAQSKFDKSLKKSDLSPDLSATIYGLVAFSRNDSKTLKTFKQLFIKASTQEEKNRLLAGMCWFKNRTLLLDVLNFSKSDSVRSQNMHIPITGMATNPYAVDILWPWLQKNWSSLSEKVGFGNPLFNRIVASISHLVDKTEEKRVRQFFKKNPVPGTERTLEQVLERVDILHQFKMKTNKEFTQGKLNVS